MCRFRFEIGEGTLSRAGELVGDLRGKRTLIVSDSNVFPLYGGQLAASLTDVGCACESYVMPAGEAHKTLATAEAIVLRLAELGFCRDDVVFALGGGVVGDVAGFAASIYMRGIRLVQCPTTLVAAVDSSIGGKTGVDLAFGKNLVGTFYPSELVICDTRIIRDLPWELTCEGMAEVIKYGAICDTGLLSELEARAPLAPDGATVGRCAELKRQTVLADEFDRGERRRLNFGHTVGHAIELLSSYRVTHGHAVAVGMVAEARLAERLGLCPSGYSARLRALTGAYGLDAALKYSPNDVIAAAARDKKNCDGMIGFSLPDGAGGWSFHLLDPTDAERGIAE